MNKRVQILMHWLQGKRNNVTLKDISFYLVKPSHFHYGKSCITRIEEEGDFLKVFFKDIVFPLYWPKEYGTRTVEGIAGELLNPDHWHYYEIEETKIEIGDVVLDCGAAEGLFALKIADKCKKVYAIEPLPKFIDAMQKTFANIENVEITPCALSDKQGKVGFIDSELTSAITYQEKTNIVVQTDTIDNLFYNQGIYINYIKADLEGFELKMLEGAIETIRNNQPKIAITTYHNPDDAFIIEKFLKKINSNYNIKCKGIEKLSGSPIMLHAWV